MSFELDAIVGSTTISLSDGAPFALMSARGMAGPPIRRVTARGPQQQGDTDLGYRLQPREIQLEIGFHAATDAILDGYRDTLTGHFKPLTSTPINLRVTRDDATQRQIDVYTVGPITISLVPEHRAAHYHRAVIRLRAPDPVWYDAAAGTVTVGDDPEQDIDWYLAGGAIGTAQVMMAGTVPANNEAWSYTGTIPYSESTESTNTWTMAVRNEGTPTAGTTSFLFLVGTAGLTVDNHVFQASVQVLPDGSQKAGTSLYPTLYDPAMNLGATIRAGTHNYFLSNYGQAGEGMYWHTGGSQIFRPVQLTIEGTARTWRSDGWTPAIERYALYRPRLSDSQRAALDTTMDFAADISAGTINTYLNLIYGGDALEYPVISITGPITTPIIINSATTRSLDFQPNSIGAGTTYVIDLRYGHKTVLDGTVDKRHELTDDSDLDTWALVPAPLAPNGLNQILVYGTGTDENTEISIVYHERHFSF